MNDNLASFADLAVELWKALRSHERTLQYVPLAQVAKIEAQIRFSNSRLAFLLEQAGLSLVSFTGIYSPNLPATVLNGDELVGGNEALIIERTVEPAIVHRQDMRIMRMGRLWLRKGSSNVSRD
ncbi:MAG TPA: hypothetical protein VHX60_00965 [Acidobacteriaceae bacterium]|jgi:hypothetical protein|nr:hypothetical protein [Acidobacteriaceae bacterium]